MKECYIDMHCHILPGVDDGAKDLAETKKMLEIAYAEGIRCIIATPHHHPHRGKASVENLRERAKLVREAAHEIDERFRVYLGTEVYFGQDVADKLKEGKILSMNRREYVLVEFPPSQTYSYIRIRSHTGACRALSLHRRKCRTCGRTVRYGCEPAGKCRQHHRGIRP